MFYLHITYWLLPFSESTNPVYELVPLTPNLLVAFECLGHSISTCLILHFWDVDSANADGIINCTWMFFPNKNIHVDALKLPVRSPNKYVYKVVGISVYLLKNIICYCCDWHASSIDTTVLPCFGDLTCILSGFFISLKTNVCYFHQWQNVLFFKGMVLCMDCLIVFFQILNICWTWTGKYV